LPVPVNAGPQRGARHKKIRKIGSRFKRAYKFFRQRILACPT
jgi:hypothetical protein